MSASLTEGQILALTVAERLTSCLSLLGVAFIFGTFAFSSRFRKPINRMIFFASIAEVGLIAATLVSEDGPASGQSSAFCQIQAVMIQFFLGADAYWALCMAINVYLAFFRGYPIKKLQHLDYWYLIICYGAALVPAFVYQLIDDGKAYGPAILWCWITAEYDILRIVTLYGIVWIAIAVALVIYLMAGKVIWQKRKEMGNFLNPFNENPFLVTVTTDIVVTHEENSVSADNRLVPGPSNFYEVSVEAGNSMPKPEPRIPDIRRITREVCILEANAESWLYARVAFLFFVSILITWGPSSANRVYSVIYPARINFPLNLASAIVLPLQGFWNACVYIISSQTASKSLWKTLMRRLPSTSIQTACNSLWKTLLRRLPTTSIQTACKNLWKPFLRRRPTTSLLENDENAGDIEMDTFERHTRQIHQSGSSSVTALNR